MNTEHNFLELFENKADFDKVYKYIKDKVDEHYSDKFIYALPDWFKLSAVPELIQVLPIYGKEGIEVCKQKVAFKVSFNDVSSVVTYVNFLKEQMCTALDVIAYVVFFVKNVKGIKDPNYKKELTDFEALEIVKYNNTNNEIEISMAFFDVDFNAMISLDEVFLK